MTRSSPSVLAVSSREGAAPPSPLIVLVTPLVEELTFRVLGLTLLEGFGTTTAIVVTVAGFLASHAGPHDELARASPLQSPSSNPERRHPWSGQSVNLV